jgi:hypothetical protein
MSQLGRDALKEYFQKGDFPTSSQMADFVDSCVNITDDPSTGSDEKVKISANDTTTNFLENKLVAGANVTLNVLNEGANETIEIVSSGGGASVWGAITGTLSNQTDLQNALDAKQNTITNSDDITEGSTNLFLTSSERSEITANTAKVSYTDAADVSSNTAFRTTPSTVITAGTNLTWDGNTLNASGGGGVAWGAISGTLSNQTDLQNELNAKQNTITNSDDITEGATNLFMSTSERSKLTGIDAGAEVNNISDVNATDLTDAGDTTLHFHSTDRARANHTGTQAASTISDFDTEVSNNSSVTANTAKTGITAQQSSDITANNAKVSSTFNQQTTGSTSSANLAWVGTVAEYNLLTPDSNTLYFII